VGVLFWSCEFAETREREMDAGKFGIAIVPPRSCSTQMRKDFRADRTPVCGGEARQHPRLLALDAEDLPSEIVRCRSQDEASSKNEALIAELG
jgi:hypothetical protein